MDGFDCQNTLKVQTRLTIVNTHALVAHFSYWPLEKELLTTNLLERYATYAKDMACSA